MHGLALPLLQGFEEGGETNETRLDLWGGGCRDDVSCRPGSTGVGRLDEVHDEVYSLAGWSAGYATASGSGTITCDNGQSARVSLRAKGGGLTAGKSKTINGSGTFSEASDISELFGTYASADVHAGAGESGAAQVVTKGTVSLAFSGTGKGIDLGVTFGEFVITKQSAKKHRK